MFAQIQGLGFLFNVFLFSGGAVGLEGSRVLAGIQIAKDGFMDQGGEGLTSGLGSEQGFRVQGLGFERDYKGFFLLFYRFM